MRLMFADGGDTDFNTNGFTVGAACGSEEVHLYTVYIGNVSALMAAMP